MVLSRIENAKDIKSQPRKIKAQVISWCTHSIYNRRLKQARSTPLSSFLSEYSSKPNCKILILAKPLSLPPQETLVLHFLYFRFQLSLSLSYSLFLVSCKTFFLFLSTILSTITFFFKKKKKNSNMIFY